MALYKDSILPQKRQLTTEPNLPVFSSKIDKQGIYTSACWNGVYTPGMEKCLIYPLSVHSRQQNELMFPQKLPPEGSRSTHLFSAPASMKDDLRRPGFPSLEIIRFNS